ncbi:MAG TPA: alginate lyase family protein [Acidobacteriaceae bacterium]|nr:alginate lyase family protein [Acidobacteriaceae bacterium]
MKRVAAGLGLMLLPLAAHGARLRSPWDGRPVTLTDAAYVCPAIQHLSPNLTTNGFYSDKRGSIIDPVKWKEYAETAGPYKKLGQEVVDAADGYRTTGSREAAECAIAHMVVAAKDGVFTGKMSSNQAYYVQGWVIGATAIAYLKIRDSGLVRRDESREILPWIVNVVRQTMRFYDVRTEEHKGDAENNHLYWAGVEVAAAGVAANNRKLFDWGIDTYHVGVNQIQPDGSLPREMRRGRRALHYHLYALAPLVYLAEFGEDNGLHLYAERDYALKKLVVLSADGLVNNSFFVKATGFPQDTPDGPGLEAEQISWAKIWEARFPSPTVEQLLMRAKSLSYMYLGGLPPG